MKNFFVLPISKFKFANVVDVAYAGNKASLSKAVKKKILSLYSKLTTTLKQWLFLIDIFNIRPLHQPLEYCSKLANDEYITHSELIDKFFRSSFIVIMSSFISLKVVNLLNDNFIEEMFSSQDMRLKLYK